MSKFKIGSDVRIKASGTIGFVLQEGVEIAFPNNDNEPCKGFFTFAELESVEDKKRLGFGH